MATEIDKLLKGFSIKEIEEIVFNAAVGLKKVNKKKLVFPDVLTSTNRNRVQHKDN